MHMAMSSNHSFCLTPRWQFTVVTSKPSSGAICGSPAAAPPDGLAFAFALALAFGGNDDDDAGALRFLELFFVVAEQITLPDMLVNKRLTNCFFASESKIQPEAASSSISSGTFGVDVGNRWYQQKIVLFLIRQVKRERKGKEKELLVVSVSNVLVVFCSMVSTDLKYSKV